jgi:hypothetical protein
MRPLEHWKKRSEETDAEEDCTAKTIAAESSSRQSGYGADCQGDKAAAISRDEVCS